MAQNKKHPSNVLTILLAVVVCTVGIIFRLYKVTEPLADFHSWRQADTAAVARNFSHRGVQLFTPTYDDLSNIQSGKENPQGYRMVEFPLYNAAITYLHAVTPNIPHEVDGRMISILFSTITIAVIFYLLRMEAGVLAAFVGSVTFATMPFFVYFTRVVLPEPTALGLSMIAVLGLYQFARQSSAVWRWVWLSASALSFASALLIKPTVIFFAIPLGYLFIRAYSWDVMRRPFMYLYWLIAFLPLLLWRQYIYQFPEGIPVSDWLITSVNTGGGVQRIFFKPAFFRWIFYERINNLILGGFLTTFFVLGSLVRPKKYLFHAMLLGTLAYLFTFQGGNVQHEYYQTLILPTIAIMVGLGMSFLYQHSRQFISASLLIPILIAIYGFSWFISFYTVHTYYNTPGDLIQIAKVVKDVTEPDAKIVTDTLGDTTLLYLSERRGAPAVFEDLPKLKAKGYRYFVTQKMDVAETIIQEGIFSPIVRTDKFVLFEL